MKGQDVHSLMSQDTVQTDRIHLPLIVCKDIVCELHSPHFLEHLSASSVASV